ncbi:arylsulfotransferase family protein [Microlunatus ginsengisoli]|uniref:Arylsulfotransferase (ASST) n=1 Tax=Microlunatus ginsengisoli TaxID=363863 RepID=A0ABP6ZMU1_9ACTN
MPSPDSDPDAAARDSPPQAGRPALSRRHFLALGAGGIVVAAGFGAADLAAGGPLRRIATKVATVTPTPAAASISPASSAMTVLTPAGSVGAGDLFISDMAERKPRLVIATSAGEELWSRSGATSYADFRPQSWNGRTVLSWWESDSTGLAAYGSGRSVVAEPDGTVITSIGTHHGVSPDEHEFLITASGTALITSYVKTRMDLTRYGGPAQGWVMDGVFEELDLATGRVLQHWSSLDHVGLAESYAGIPEDPDEPYDYFHINSVEPTPDGHFLVSARHTWGLYKVDRDTGKVLWRLGGRRSDFDLAGPAAFAWQHDARFETAGTIRLFDNGSDGTVTATSESRVLWLDVDQAARSATLIRRLSHPDRLSAAAMGNAELLANGNLVVGWGTAKRISEFAPDGSLVFDAALPNMTYRCFRDTWR